MTVVFADTSFFVAFLSSTDQYHTAAHDHFGRQLVTSNALTPLGM